MKRKQGYFQKCGKLRLLQKWRSFLGNFFKIGFESADQLFASCSQISPIWYCILRWLGVKFVPPHGILGLFEVLLGMGMGRKDSVDLGLIWIWWIGCPLVGLSYHVVDPYPSLSEESSS
ncbi:hypothetical protein A2U01_0005947 [Trifolium medium]|uniref:Transmembrane protein n=1 Tax=Trifolium medium TaxID=97028 RepID=A0A392MDB5_9FABA|nr:hypothetical protein [Trifolium medium]